MSADWALSLFRKSVLKREKYRRITNLLWLQPGYKLMVRARLAH